MIKIKNIQTGEIKNVYNTEYINGHVKSNTGKPLGKRFANSWEGVLTETTGEDGQQIFTLSTDWEVVTGKGDRKPRQPKPVAVNQENNENKPKPQPTIKPDAAIKDVEDVVENITTNEPTEDVNEQALIAAIKNLRGGAVDMAKVREIVREELTKLATAEPAKVKSIIKKAGVNSNEYRCSDFEEIADYIGEGQPVYMYGAAGCGKSHTAEQIASALNLDYYTQSQVLFAHDVKGYGDANGNYQETPFFKAFTKGGLFFIDEMDASAPEALVVLNTAIANRRYDFPIIGCVEAHPNFRIIAAGNTALTGADVEYTARSVQDASTINRFAFFEMHYEKNVEFNVMAKGDKELYNFVVDLRNAIKTAGIQLCVSYRQTSILASDLAQKYGKAKALKRNVFGGRETDEIRIIYGSLKNKDNAWAKAIEELIK